MQPDQTWIMKAIRFAREYFVPVAALVSFFPVYFWTYVYALPREVRILLDGGFYSAIAFDLLITCAACGFIARISAYQIATSFGKFISFPGSELKYAWAKPIQSAVNSVGPYLTNDALLSTSIFLIAITSYFIGIVGIIILLLYEFMLFSALGSAEKTAIMSRGNMDIEATGDFQLAIRTLSTISFQEMLSRHLSFLSMAILALPFCLGAGRFVSLVGNDDVALSVNSNVVQSKLIASIDAGLLFMASADAQVLRLMTWRPTDYFLLMPNGKVVCLGERNTTCTP